MAEHVQDGFNSARAERADTIFRWLIIALVAAVLGAVGLFGYTIWRNSVAEKSATPAQRALQQLGDLVRANPSSAAARVRYGEALGEAGLLEDATEQFKHAVKIDPKHTGAWLDLGVVAMQDDDREGAETYFQKVIELTEGAQYENINQRREQALFHMGEIKLDDKQYEEAAGYFKGALRIRRDASDTYYLLAQSLSGLGKNEAALGQLEAALTFDPNYAEAHYLYGSILMESDDRLNAAVHFVKAAEIKPEAPLPKRALQQLGTADAAMADAREALAAKRYDEAVDSALLARTLDAKSAEAAILHVEVLLARGDAESRKAAAAVFKEAEKLDPKNPALAKLRPRLSK